MLSESERVVFFEAIVTLCVVFFRALRCVTLFVVFFETVIGFVAVLIGIVWTLVDEFSLLDNV